MRTRTAQMLMAAAVAVLLPVGSAAASALHPRFQLIARHLLPHPSTSYVFASGRYAMAVLAQGADGVDGLPTKFLLIDDKAGQQGVISPPRTKRFSCGCEVDGFAPPWILLNGVGAFELYNLHSHKWRPLACGGQCQGDVTAMGSRWIQFTNQLPGDCGDGVHFSCGPTIVKYFDINSHRVRQPPELTSREVVDLSSRTLVRRVCAPLPAAAGPVTQYGRFAIVHLSNAAGLQDYLEKCGSRLRLGLDDGGSTPTLTAHEVTWPVAGGYVGILLPSLRRFRVSLPDAALASDPGSSVALDDYRFYFADRRENLQAAPFPPRAASR
jgi:hypothetical protein